MKNFKFIALFLLIGFCVNSYSQKKQKIKISILVKDSKNKPVPGAIILFDDLKHPRRTNEQGVFKIKMDTAPKEISAFFPTIGIQKVKYVGEKKLVITIKTGNDSYVVSTPKVKSIDTKQFRNIYDYLRGQVPGVNITSDNVINIRGYNSVNGSTTPMFILNNNQVDQLVFGDIVPTTIKSVVVLKGPETAMYGSRGANGVIKVTTL
ncbi:MAG: TonB-dependent receptor plug domain-containing protein [Polaribacter sp.]